MDMELSELEAFVMISRTGGFTRAAELLHISQPAISRRIELLEREVGAPVFERLSSGVRMTEAGTVLLPFAQQVLAAISDGKAAVRALDTEEGGTLTLALVGTLASTQLTTCLRDFHATYPQVHLRLRTARSDEVSTLVQQGEAQVGLRYFGDPRPDMQSLLVLNEQLVVACAAHSRLVPDDLAELSALGEVPWVTFPLNVGSSGEMFARVLEQQLLRNDLQQAERIVIDSLSAQKRMIEADFGIGLLPASSIVEELQLGTLRLISLPGVSTSVPVMAIHRRHAYLSRAARRLLEVLTIQDSD